MLRCIHAEALRLGNGDFLGRLARLVEHLDALLVNMAPHEVAIENVYLARNPDSALKLGQARGAALAVLVRAALPIHEYGPMQIKKAVVGRGRAEKGQVQHMVSVLLGLDHLPAEDAADALAVAICHAHSSGAAGADRDQIALSWRRYKP